METKARKFEFKQGKFIVPFGTNTPYTNDNLTDEKALEFLQENPNRIDLFKKYPKDWKDLLNLKKLGMPEKQFNKLKSPQEKIKLIDKKASKREYDIALSFASEQKKYVEKVANLLKKEGVSTFYFEAEKVHLWGKDLYTYLDDIYKNKAELAIMFISKEYKDKLWTNQERKAMQQRAFEESKEYILPARFDKTEIPGLSRTICYIELKDKIPERFVEIIKKKLVDMGLTIPSENLRSALYAITPIPKINPKEVCITVRESKQPIQNVEVVLIADNGTTLQGITDKNGKSKFEIKTKRTYNVIAAHPDYPSKISENFNPDEEDLIINLNSAENMGSVISHSTCYIKGLKGRLNPILDTLNRMYFYADNISIDGGKKQPVPFELNVPIKVEDNDGLIMNLIFRFIKGSTAVIDYIKPIYE